MEALFKKKSANAHFLARVVNIRDLGKLLFLVVRLYSQKNNSFLQVVVQNTALIKKIKKISNGDLIKVFGTFVFSETNNWELLLKDFKFINSSTQLPFLAKDDLSVNEDTRFRYRYLDLRRPVIFDLFLKKNQFIFALRRFFFNRKFIELETPILSHFSPEGAKCFLVLSNFKDRFYTLSQSPQMYKQLLMIADFEKYYQFSKSFRNEDARSNRQIEFTQLDVEQSFVSEKNLMRLVETLLFSTIKKIFPTKIISFFSITYQEAINRFSSEKPDLRSQEEKQNSVFLKFVWVTDWPLFFLNKETSSIHSLRHPFTQPRKEYLKRIITGEVALETVISSSFDLVCNGEEILSGGLRINQRVLQEKIFKILGYSEEQRAEYFGFFLEALSFAAPPHGGFGLGIDRLLAIILEKKSLKELLAFPKNIDGSCPLSKTPNFLKENHVRKL